MITSCNTFKHTSENARENLLGNKQVQVNTNQSYGHGFWGWCFYRYSSVQSFVTVCLPYGTQQRIALNKRYRQGRYFNENGQVRNHETVQYNTFLFCHYFLIEYLLEKLLLMKAESPQYCKLFCTVSLKAFFWTWSGIVLLHTQPLLPNCPTVWKLLYEGCLRVGAGASGLCVLTRTAPLNSINQVQTDSTNAQRHGMCKRCE